MKKKIISVMIGILLAIITLPSEADHAIDENSEEQLCIGLAPITPQYSKSTNIDHQNNHIQPALRDTYFYAYNANDPSGTLVEGPVKFEPTVPELITQIAPTTSDDYITGGTWTDKDNGTWYGCEFGGNGHRNIWIIDNQTGNMTLVGSYYPEAYSLNGLAYDPSTEVMYGCSSNKLYIIDMTTGASSEVGSFGIQGPEQMVGIAFDTYGTLYGVELRSDSLYQINTSTASVTLIGELGIDINYQQDIAYDFENYILYLAAYTVAPTTETALYTCNTTTGATTKIGTFQGNAELTGFAIPYNVSTPPPDITPPVTNHTTIPTSPDGTHGWYKSEVTITVNSEDERSGVRETNYSIDNGKTWHTSESWPIEIDVGEGTYKLLYYSVDNVGNTETTKGPFNIKIDITVPNIFLFSIPVWVGPFNLAVFNLGLAKDSFSGLEKVEYFFNYRSHHETDLSMWPTGLLCPLFWPHPGPIGSVYTARAYDKAGNWHES
ncbi:MAG: OmpL47-type beta-barrel domain-containing protein [Petrotogales bacterium]